jgi:hypothetical protein
MTNQDISNISSSNPLTTSAGKKKLSDTSSSSPVNIPTPPVSSEPDSISLNEVSRMESSQENVDPQVDDKIEKGTTAQQIPPPLADEAEQVAIQPRQDSTKKGKRVVKKPKRKTEVIASSDVTESDSGSGSDHSSEEEKAKRRRKRKLAAKRAAKKDKLKAKAKKNKKAKKQKHDTTSEDDSSSEVSDSESELEVKAKRHHKKATRAKARRSKNKKLYSSSDDDSSSDSSSDSSTSDSDSAMEKAKRRRRKAKAKRKGRQLKKADSSSSSEDLSSAEEDETAVPPDLPIDPLLPGDDITTQVSKILGTLKLKHAAASAAVSTTKLDKPIKKNALEFKRVDQVYDMKIHDWKLVESNTDQKDEFDCVFTVRRRLDWEGKYKETQVDIKSKLLRNALQDVFKECKSISLVEDTPQIDPHTLFHYYDELKTYVKKILKPKSRKARRTKMKKQLRAQIAQCRLLLSYLDEDYEATRRALKPMLKAGTITYDLVWALFKPNTIAFTPTYANKDDPRCFKVDFTYEYESWMTGAKSWVVDGRYLEYDGKGFGLGDHQVQIQAFKGHKKITSLGAYPLNFHKDPEVSNARVVPDAFSRH